MEKWKAAVWWSGCATGVPENGVACWMLSYNRMGKKPYGSLESGVVMHGDTVKVKLTEGEGCSLVDEGLSSRSAKDMTVLMYLLPPRTTPEVCITP